MHANIEAVQAETRGALDTICAFQAEVLYRLERLETSPAPKFVAGLDSGEMTVAPYHSAIEPESVTGPRLLRRSERLVNKPKVGRLSPNI